MFWKMLVPGTIVVAAAVALGFFWPFQANRHLLHLPGVVEIQEVRLGSKIGGRVARVAVSEGDLVKPGQELVIIEAPELQAQREQWEARLQAAQADLEKARNGSRPEEIREANNDLQAAQADLVLARQEYERVEKLQKIGAAARSDFDAAHATRDRDEKRVGAALARLDLLKAGTRSEDITAAMARVAEIRGKIHEIEANLDEAIVRAPELAVVDVLSVRKGDLVAPNQPIIRVLRADDLWVRVYVPETQLGQVRLGQNVDVTIDSYPGERFKGKVVQVSAESEFTPRNVQSVDERRHQVFGMKVRVAQPEDPSKRVFKSGMAAEVILPLQGTP